MVPSVVYILLHIIAANVVFGKFYNNRINQPLCRLNPICMQKAFFGSREPNKINDSRPQKQQNDGLRNKFKLPDLFTENVKKAIVVAGGTVLASAVCYRYVSSMLKHYLYDRYIRPDAPDISEALGHVLYANITDIAPVKSTSNIQKVLDIVIASLMKVGWLRGLYKPGIKRISIGEAIDEDTITAIYFHSANIDKVLKEQGFMEFTPKLKSIYEAMKSKGKKFQVVYVNLDNNQSDAVDHFKDMPWYALPFGDKERIINLCKLYDVMSVPSVVLLDSTGRVVNDRALYLILNRPNDYPWKVDNVLDLIPQTLTNVNNQSVPSSKLGEKIVGLYFGAGWTKSSKDFAGKLSDYYSAVNKKTDDRFEIVYVSNDKNAESFETELSENNSQWLSIPFEDTQSRSLLQHYLRVQSLPALVLIGPYGNIISRDGRFYVETDRNAEHLPYKSYLHHDKSKVEDISDNIDGFAHYPVVIAFVDTDSPKEQESVEAELNNAANEHSNNRKGREFKFFISKLPHKRTDAIKVLCGVKNNKPQVVILDLLRQSVYYDPKLTKITQHSILDLIDDYYKGNLKQKTLSIP